MAELPIRSCDLDSILTNCRDDHTDEELQEFEQELATLTYIDDLWKEFGDIPMNPETECLEFDFVVKKQDSDEAITVFEAGTHREDIWHWFEETFGLCVAEDLMY